MSNLHLHHPELEAGPCDPALVRQEAQRAFRAARHAADIAWDQRQNAACGHLNIAAHQISSAIEAIRSEGRS